MTSCVADEVVATFARRQHDWMERVIKGSLDPENVARAVQAVVDRKPWFSTENKTTLVPHQRWKLEEHKKIFGFTFKNIDWRLQVSENLHGRVSLGDEPVYVGKHELTGDMCVWEIEHYLPESLFFQTVKEAQVVIAHLLHMQFRGEDGYLSTKKPNYFLIYVKDTDLAGSTAAIRVYYFSNGGPQGSGWLVEAIPAHSWMGSKLTGGWFVFTK